MTRYGRISRTILLPAILLLLLGVGAAGCGTTSEPLPGLDLNPYTVTFATDPETPAAGKSTVMKVGVTGKDPLTKRSEVSFEIKKIGSEERKEIPAERKADDRFEGEFTFQEAGRYSITIHVITRTVHQVVNKELEVK